jgi:hypothetical protein
MINKIKLGEHSSLNNTIFKNFLRIKNIPPNSAIKKPNQLVFPSDQTVSFLLTFTFPFCFHLHFVRVMGFIPEELTAEILTYLDVKTIARLKCVNKSWNALISNPTFVQKHLNKSSQNPHLTILYKYDKDYGYSLVPIPVRRLLENPSITIQKDTSHNLEFCYHVAGSCNGLICLVSDHVYATQHHYRCSFWNPSTGKTYQGLVVLRYDLPRDYVNTHSCCRFMFTFGYDDSTGTYKVVAYNVKGGKKNKASGDSEVKVFSVGDGDNCWRNIQSFPVIPLDWHYNPYTRANHLNGTINWLSLFFS